MARLISASMTPLRAACDAEERRVASALTLSVQTTARHIKEDMREQTQSAGLSSVIANGWRGEGFPGRAGKVSLHPTGMVWSRMPKIAERYLSGNDTVPINGHTYLAIPRQNVRLGRRRARITVAEMQARMKQKLIVVPGKNGNKLGFFDMSLSNRTGQRRRGEKRRDLVLFYVFVKVVKGRKVFDLKGAAATNLADLPGQVQARLLTS